MTWPSTPSAPQILADGAVLGSALVLASGTAATVARLGRWFLPVLLGIAALLAPALLVVVAADGSAIRIAALAILLTPALVAPWRRMPPGQWRAARALKASPLLVVTALVLPVVWRATAGAALLGGSLLAVAPALRDAAVP